MAMGGGETGETGGIGMRGSGYREEGAKTG